ncbi:MAG: phosphatidylserine decarboxylase family protein [Chitinophagaceae bacterium]|nr:phosphatidylserine decarboxylase family protein [Bacteroidota bacterium]MCC6258830.1 phosphatidylserine decarboxylase family protein [Chitinophagaceae bacterium]
MTIHREGYKSIAVATLLFGAINLIIFWFLPALPVWISAGIFMITLAVFLLIISFFRIPSRKLTINDDQIIAPADGKVVVIEEVFDTEYFNAKCLQISVFMSPLNVHVNRCPVAGEVIYNQYHKGKYLVAWHPKSSTENERHSSVIQKGKYQVLVKQIAGALAKRIVNYLEVGQKVNQCEELGFIKFGSRVDLLLPPDVKVNVQLNQVVQGGVSVLATFS